MFLKILKILCVLVAALLIIPTSVVSDPFDNWEEGDEVEITGHSFEEEYWTSEVTNETDEGEATFVISYVNTNDVQAYLVAFKGIETDNSTGTLPYQMYGLHYFTPDGNEVFLSALLAFLMVYDDTNNNSIPSEGEPISYVIPIGIGNSFSNGTYDPVVTPIAAKKIGEGHYQFGMKYENLYAFVSPNPLWSWVFKTGWIAKFSELTITYDITIDSDKGEVKTETFYTIGQVTELWAFIGGFPIEADPADLPETLGLSAVHFVSIFTSKYKVTGETTNHTLSPTGTELADENVSIKVGEKDERAFAIRFYGDFDLIDEDTSTTIAEDQSAYNILLQAKFKDLLLVAWQLGFSARVFSVFAYALSDYVQGEYSSPRDLAEKSLRPFNPKGFGVRALWYAVCFPSWQGYRVEHDPTYVGYFGAAQEGEAEEATGVCASTILIVGFAAVPGIAVVDKKRKRKKK
jgi:hypothetical protein